MNYLFQPQSNEAHYKTEEWLNKKYKDKAITNDMMALWEYLDNAKSAFDIKAHSFYYFHFLSKDYHGCYSISPSGKNKKYRLIVACLDENKKECVLNGDEKAFLTAITTLEIKELTDHYDE